MPSEHHHVRLAASFAAIFFAIGWVPVELIVPFLVKLFQLRGLVFIALSLHKAIYVVGFILSLNTLLNHASGRRYLEKRKFGRFLLKLLGHKNSGRLHGWRLVVYEIWYHAGLAVFGFFPIFVKFAIARCSLYPRFSAISCVVTATTLGSYLIVYYGVDVLNWFIG
ncbi:MAG: hypothetical protein WCV50_01510 [Patescibacteria group bacterium]|jgi:hypothetical protein